MKICNFADSERSTLIWFKSFVENLLQNFVLPVAKVSFELIWIPFMCHKHEYGTWENFALCECMTTETTKHCTWANYTANSIKKITSQYKL